MREIVKTCLYGFYVIFHPFDGFWELKTAKKSTFNSALVFYILLNIVIISKLKCTDFKFNPINRLDDINILVQVIIVTLLIMIWVVFSWAITTLADGKGTVKEIFVSTVFSFIPIIIIYPAIIAISYILTLQESMFYELVRSFAVIWSGWLMLTGNATIHEYSIGKMVFMTFLTLLGTVAALFVGMVFYSSIQQLIGFFLTIIYEIKFWG